MIETREMATVRRVVEGLKQRSEAVVAAMVADGWSAAMARAGLERHWRRWDVEVLARQIAVERKLIEAEGRHFFWPRRVHHIWPALPGASFAEVLVGMLLGVDQGVKASRRSQATARTLLEATGVELLDDDRGWSSADLVMVSGSDATLGAVRQEMVGRGRVVGFGHRVSLAVVDDEGRQLELGSVAEAIAADVVMWHQRGCFSVRAVLFCGGEGRRRVFGRKLATAIAKREKAWGIDGVTKGELAARAQSIGVAQLTGPIFVDGLGYVRIRRGPFRGDQEAVHAVTVHALDGPQGVERAIDVPAVQLQGASLSCGAEPERREAWERALGQTGFTRICKAGLLQSPPASWWHDGRPLTLDWGRATTLG